MNEIIRKLEEITDQVLCQRGPHTLKLSLEDLSVGYRCLATAYEHLTAALAALTDANVYLTPREE